MSEQQPWTKYLKLPDFRRCIVSIYIFTNRGTGDDRRYENIAGLAKLTSMAGFHKPCYIGSEVRPPKVIHYLSASCEVSMMSGFIMGGDENRGAFIRFYN